MSSNVEASRVAVVGGSIAGCATAIALGRLGCEVEVFERSSGALRDRGSGIAIPLPLRDELVEVGYLPADYPSCVPAHRHWTVADGTEDGALLWRQPSAAAMSNWGVLWRSLRAGVPDGRYHDAVSVDAITGGTDGASITFDDGTTSTFDVVIGADGYRSTVRPLVVEAAEPEYAGYVLWRGNFPEDRLSDRVAIETLDSERAWLTVGFAGGHAVMYPIPDFDDSSSAGRRRINWAIYAPKPDGLDIPGPSSIPPGGVDQAVYGQLKDLADKTIPSTMRPLFDSPREEVSIQPIYDLSVDRYVNGRVALIGDAATITRPHTGSGATKAMQDARTLELLGADHRDWNSLLAAYDADRVAVGRDLVDLGRRIGRDQVEHTPPWADMRANDFTEWTTGTLSGQTLYFWGNDD